MFNNNVDPILEQISFIGGCATTLVFNVVGTNGTPYDLDGYECSFSLARTSGGKSSVVLNKTGTVKESNTNQFEVILDTADTKNLFGKFKYQLTAQVTSDKVYEVGQGYCIIAENINR